MSENIKKSKTLFSIPALVLLFDRDFRLTQIIRDNLKSADHVKEGMFFIDLVSKPKINRAQEFLDEIAQNQSAYNFLIEISIGEKSDEFNFYGWVIGGSIIIVGFTLLTGETEFYYDEILKIDNEQVNMLRSVYKEKNLLQGAAKTDREIYDDFSRINNELTTTQRQLEKANAELSIIKNEWEATFSSVSEMIMIIDTEGRVIRCNRAVEIKLGKSADNLKMKKVDELFQIDRQEFFKPGDDVRFLKFPELEGFFEVSHFPYNFQNEIFGTVLIIQDVSRRKIAEEQYIEAQKLASIGTMAAGIAHEINTPLQVIVGIAGRILERLEENKIVDIIRLKKNINTINEQGWRSAKIIKALMSYSRPFIAKFTPNYLNEIAQDVILLTRFELQASRNIKLYSELKKDLPAFLCDQSSITVALTGLIKNARDALPDGGKITIRTDYDEITDQLILEVENNGKIIPEDVKNRIFDPFFTTKPVGEGYGLGLSIVYGIIQAHKGKIELKSEIDGCTIFKIYIPRNNKTKPAESKNSIFGRYDE